MKQGCRVGTRPLLGMIVFIAAFMPFLLTPSVDAFVALHIDGRPIDATPALAPVGSGMGIAVPLLQSELGFSVDEGDWPTVVLGYGDRTAQIVVDGVDAVVDGQAIKLSAAPRVQEETLFVPISFVADIARFRMDLDLLQGVLTLTSRDGESRPVVIVAEDPAVTVRAEGAGDSPSGFTQVPDPPVVARKDGSEDTLPGASSEARLALPEPTAAEPDSTGADPDPDEGERPSSDPVPNEPEPGPSVVHIADDGVAPPDLESDDLPSLPVIATRPDTSESRASDRPSRDPLAEDASPADGLVVLQDVQTVRRDGHVHIEVFTDVPVTPRVVLLDNPARLVIDVEGAVSATGWQTSPGDGRVIEQVRVHGGEEGGVRIVADLFRATGYSVAAEETGFILRLNHPLQLLQATGADGEGIVLDMAATGPVPYRMFPLREPDRVVIDLFGVSIPGAEEVAVDGDWAQTFRLSQFQQDAVRGVFVLHPESALPLEPTEGVLQPESDGTMRLAVAAEGLSTPAARETLQPGTTSDNTPGIAQDDTPGDILGATPDDTAGNTLQFVGFGRTGDLEYILIRADEPLDVDVLRLRGPDRLVLDIPGLFVGRSLGLMPDDSRIVKAVRAGQAGDASARIVAETFGVAEHYLLLSPDRTRAVIGLRPSGLGGRTVVVDAGHGGKDPGAIGHSGTYEKDVTLSIALQVAALLGEAGANVVLTRDRDVELTLAERAQMANALLADAFVSIHADAIGFGRIASGTSTFYHPENGSSSDTSVNRQYALTLQNELLQRLGLPDRGIHERRFHVVLNTRMPAALVEVGFIDNPDEEQLLLNAEFQARAAAGIADGILRFFGEQDAPSPEQVQQWRTRTERAAGLWLVLGIVPGGVSALEPTPLFSVAQTENRASPEVEFDVTRSP